MFSALSAAKWVVSGVVGIGTGKIVGGIVKNHVAIETQIDKVTITAASWVISAMAVKATKNHTNELIDEVVGGVTEAVSDIKLAQKLNRINKGESTFENEGLNEADFEKTVDGKYKKAETIQRDVPAAA